MMIKLFFHWAIFFSLYTHITSSILDKITKNLFMSKSSHHGHKNKTTALDKKMKKHQDIFYSHLSDDLMLKRIETAEQELKIFIYPLPQNPSLKALKETDVLPQFRSE